jgi:hypothetical protein
MYCGLNLTSWRDWKIQGNSNNEESWSPGIDLGPGSSKYKTRAPTTDGVLYLPHKNAVKNELGRVNSRN